MGDDGVVPGVVLELADGLYDLTAVPKGDDGARSDEENEEEASWQRPPAMEDDDEWRLAAVASLRASAEQSDTTETAWTEARNDEDRLTALRDLRRMAQQCQKARAWSERRILATCFKALTRFCRESSALQCWIDFVAERRIARFSLRILLRNVREQRVVRAVRAIRTRRRLARWRVAVRARRTAAKLALVERRQSMLRAIWLRGVLRNSWKKWRQGHLEANRQNSILRVVNRLYLRAPYEIWRESARRKRDLIEIVKRVQARQKLRLARAKWRERTRLSREVSQILLRFACRNRIRAGYDRWFENTVLRDRRRASAMADWISFVALRRKRRILDRARTRRLFQRSLDTWRSWVFEARERHAERNAIALHHWARSLEAKCFASLRRYASRRLEKKIQARNALEARFVDLRKVGCATILAAADASRQMREEALRDRATKDLDLVARCLAKWRSETRLRADKRRRRRELEGIEASEEQLPPPPVLVAPQNLRRVLVPPMTRPRPAPRRLTDSLLSSPDEARREATSASSHHHRYSDTNNVNDEQDKVTAMVVAAVAAAVNNGQASARQETAENQQLPPPPPSQSLELRKEDRARTILALQDKLDTWQRQKKAWIAALADSDQDYRRALHEEYRAWKRDIAPKVRRCAQRLEDIYRDDFNEDSSAATLRHDPPLGTIA